MSEMPTIIASPRYELGGARVVAIGDEASSVFQRFRQSGALDVEAGGVLLGRIIRLSGDIVVDVAVEPDRSDQRSRFRFRRKRAAAQLRVSQEWERSDGTRIYLGEWHTHAEPIPTPSSLDRREWLRLAVETRYEQERLLFIIVGTKCTRLWSVCRDDLEPREHQLRREQ